MKRQGGTSALCLVISDKGFIAAVAKTSEQLLLSNFKIMAQNQPSESQSKSCTVLKLVEEKNCTGLFIKIELGKTGFKNMSKFP